jgi:YggT family protein
MAQQWSNETPDREESVRVQDDGVVEHRERVVTDTAAERRNIAYTMTQVVWLLFGILMGLIGLRILLMLIGANPSSPFAGFVYGITDAFLWPFAGLTPVPSLGNLVLDIPAIIALFAYWLLAWVLVKIIKLILLRPAPSTSVETYRRDRR